MRVQAVEKQIDSMHKVVIYSLGQSTETQFRQSQQESKLDDVFKQLEKFLANKEPV